MDYERGDEGGYWEFRPSTLDPGVIKGDTRSLDSGSHGIYVLD